MINGARPAVRRDAEVRRRGRLSRTQIFRELERSLLLHIRRPLILTVVVCGALLQFGIETWAGLEAPVPADLAGMFGVPPLDSFTWVHSAVGLLPVLLLLLIRITVIWVFVCLVLGLSPGGGNFIRTSGAYLITVLSFGLAFAALAWLGPLLGGALAGLIGAPGQDGPYLATSRLALGIVLYFVFVPVLALLAVAISPLPARAAAGSGLKVRLRQPSIWGLVCLSALLYLTVVLPGQGRTEATSAGFLLAFVVLSLQSLIYAAIVHISAGSGALRRLAGQA